METTLDKLKQQATDLGIKYSPNIGEETLKTKIAEKLDEISVNKPSETSNEDEVKLTRMQKIVEEAKKKAFKKSFVTITNLDKRENEEVTTAYLGFENLYFDLSRIVPLNVVVELEDALIKVAQKAPMTIHVQDPKTGNKIPKTTNKYSVNFEQKPTE